MNPILKNFIAVVIGLIVGGAINMGVILISDSIIPPPPGADVTTTEGLIASMHLFEPKHFIMPFLAHAIGTFAGALITALMAANNNMKLAILIGLFNLVGGIMASEQGYRAVAVHHGPVTLTADNDLARGAGHIRSRCRGVDERINIGRSVV